MEEFDKKMLLADLQKILPAKIKYTLNFLQAANNDMMGCDSHLI